MTLKTSDYVVTDKAGRCVAARVVSEGQILSLTEAEAEYELLQGTIKPVQAQSSGALKDTSKDTSKPLQSSSKGTSKG